MACRNKHFKTAVALDFNEKPQIHLKNMPDAIVITGDITDDNIKEIINKAKEKGKYDNGSTMSSFSMKGKS